MHDIPGLDDIREAAARIVGEIHRTPTMTCQSFNERFACELYFKCENFQKTGAFKARGAINTVFSMDKTRLACGVATHSSGNHAAALALAARLKGIPAYIVMPENASRVKVDAVLSHGAEIIFCEATLAAREAELEKIVEKTGACIVHPYNDYRVIAGQATVALELFEQVKDLDLILAPVGGGGLLSGTALAAHYLSPNTRVIACEPMAADDALRSFQSGQIVPSLKPETIADGLLTSLGSLTYPIIREHVSDIVTVSEDAIIEATRLIMEYMKVVVEPSAAVTLAALLENKLDVEAQKTGLILSGGNIDLEKFFEQTKAEEM